MSPALRATVALLIPLVVATGAIDPPVVRLTRPLAEFPATFDQLNSAMELRDGRVLVTDVLGPTVQLVDFATGTRTPLGRKGAGPNEYAFPDRPLRLGGDSLVVVDVGQSRFLRVAPDGRLDGTFAFPAAAGMGAQFRGADARGNLYYVGSRYAAGAGRGVNVSAASGAAPDSAPLIRWDRTRNRVDTLAKLRQAPLAKPTGSGGSRSTVVMLRSQPFGATDDWAVTPDGRVAVFRAADYRIDWIGSDLRRTSSAPIPYERVRVLRADRDQILKPAQALTSNGGKFTVPPSKESDFDWPEYKPPFVAQFTLCTPEGLIWVQRSVAEGGEPVYDEIDTRGRVVRRVVLAKGGRVVGFGKGVVYVTRSDEDDLIHLQKFTR